MMITNVNMGAANWNLVVFILIKKFSFDKMKGNKNEERRKPMMASLSPLFLSPKHTTSFTNEDNYLRSHNGHFSYLLNLYQV